MKKILVALLALALCLANACALALSGSTYPAYDEPERDTFCGVIDGLKVRLGFNALYRIDDRGRLQLNFFVCDDDGNPLDLYVTLPSRLREGDVIAESDSYGLILGEGTGSGEREYTAGLGGSGEYSFTVVSAKTASGLTRLRIAVEGTPVSADGAQAVIREGMIDIEINLSNPGAAFEAEPESETLPPPFNARPSGGIRT